MGFDPVTAAVVVGTGLQIYGTYAGVDAAKKEARFSAGVLRNNQKIAKKQAGDIVTRGLAGAKELESDAIRFADDQLLRFAGSGIAITSGVAVKAVEDTARVTAADIIQLQHNVAQDVWATEVGIGSLASEELLAGFRVRNLQRTANLTLLSSILSSGAKIGARQSRTTLPGGV